MLRVLGAVVALVFAMGTAMTADAKTAYDFSFETIEIGRAHV